MNDLDPWYSPLRWVLLFTLTGYVPGAAAEEPGAVAAPDTSATAGFDRLRGFLESRGWRVERTADGSIFLIPLGETSEVQDQRTSVPPDPKRVDDIDRLRDALDAHGWHVQRGTGESLLLIPAPGPAPEEPAAAAPASAADCAGRRQDLSVAAGVEFPVNTRKEAWQISVNWLWESGYHGLTVRNIREFYWFYLVSIVDDRPPYRPRGQLIINKRTGQLFASF